MVAGVDEVGRGALFGPVVAAAVILPEGCRIPGLRDSKQLIREERERLALIIERRALAIAIEEVDSETIDRINIYQATRVAMTAAVCRLAPVPDHLLVDALRLDFACAQTSIIYGDSLDLHCRCFRYRQGLSRQSHAAARPRLPGIWARLS